MRAVTLLLWISVWSLAVVSNDEATAERLGWSDTFYQYRITFDVNATASGWNVLPITAEQVTAAVNGLGRIRRQTVGRRRILPGARQR